MRVKRFKVYKFRKNTKFKSCKQSFNINVLLAECNLMTILESRDLFLYKYAFKNLQHTKSSSATRRTWLLLSVPSLKFGQKSINYRGIKLWNKLPRDWDPKMTLTQYEQACREFIISNRQDQFYYF